MILKGYLSEDDDGSLTPYLYIKIGRWDQIICQQARKHYHQRSPYMASADKADKREQEQGVHPRVRWEESTRVAGMIAKQILLDGKNGC